MTRREIEKEYNVKDGRIISPGRFEGEMIYVPHFWSLFLDGLANRDNGHVLGFDVHKKDRVEFPELGRRRTVKLYQRSDGFVCEC
jgi:hypothetical protein